MPDEVTTSQALERLGFGSSMTDRFWKPFMRGVFLENGLRTSVRKFEETFRLFAEGETALPRLGIGEIPKQMARSLPSESLRLGHSIVCMSGTGSLNPPMGKVGGADGGSGHRIGGRRSTAWFWTETKRHLGIRWIASTSVCPV